LVGWFVATGGVRASVGPRACGCCPLIAPWCAEHTSTAPAAACGQLSTATSVRTLLASCDSVAQPLRAVLPRTKLVCCRESPACSLAACRAVRAGFTDCVIHPLTHSHGDERGSTTATARCPYCQCAWRWQEGGARWRGGVAQLHATLACEAALAHELDPVVCASVCGMPRALRDIPSATRGPHPPLAGSAGVGGIAPRTRRHKPAPTHVPRLQTNGSVPKCSQLLPRCTTPSPAACEVHSPAALRALQAGHPSPQPVNRATTIATTETTQTTQHDHHGNECGDVHPDGWQRLHAHGRHIRQHGAERCVRCAARCREWYLGLLPHHPEKGTCPCCARCRCWLCGLPATWPCGRVAAASSHTHA